MFHPAAVGPGDRLVLDEPVDPWGVAGGERDRVHHAIDESEAGGGGHRIGAHLFVVEVVVVRRPFGDDHLRGGQQPVGVVGAWVREHNETSEIGCPQVVEPTGVDPDLLRPLDRLLVYQLAESRVIADRARAEQFRHLVVVLARLRDDRHAGRDRPGLDQAGRAEPRRTTAHACRHGVDRHVRFGRRRPPDGGVQPRRGRTQPGGTATEARSA